MSYRALSAFFLGGLQSSKMPLGQWVLCWGFHPAAKRGQAVGENRFQSKRGTPGEGNPSMGRAGGARAWPGQGSGAPSPARLCGGNEGGVAKDSSTPCPWGWGVPSGCPCPWAVRAEPGGDTLSCSCQGERQKRGLWKSSSKICCSLCSFESKFRRYCKALSPILGDTSRK